MAKGDVVMKFDADTADFVNKMTKMRQELIASGSASRQFAREIEVAGVKLGSLRDIKASVAGEIQGLAQSHLSFGSLVGNAMNLAQTAWGLFGKQVEDISRKTKQQTDDLAKTMAGIGQAGLLPEARLRLQNISTPGLNMEQRAKLFQQAAEGSPDKSLDQLISMVQAAAKGKLAGKDPAKMLQVMGAMEDAGAKGDAQSLANRANRFLELSGGKGLDDSAKNALLRFTQTKAGDVSEGLGFLLATMKAGGSPGQLGSLVDKLANVQAPERNLLRALSPKEKAQQQLAGLSMRERFQLVTGDRTLAADLLGSEEASQLLGASGSKLQAVLASGVSGYTDEMRRSGFSLNRTAMELSRDPRFRASLNEDKLLAEADDATMRHREDQAMRYRVAKGFVTRRNAGDPVRTAAAMAALDMGEKTGIDPETILGELAGEGFVENEQGGMVPNPESPTLKEFRSLLPQNNLRQSAEELEAAAHALGRANREGREELLPPGMETGRKPAR